MATSQIRKKKVGNTTITQNLTTGRTTYSTRHGQNTMSTSVGAGKPMRHKTTRTVDYGAGIIQRSTVHSFTDSAPARTASKKKTKQQYKAPNEDDHATSPKDLVENEYGAALAASIWLCIIVGLLITYPYETSIILGTIIVSGLVIAYWPIVLTCSIVYIIAKLLFF